MMGKKRKRKKETWKKKNKKKKKKIKKKEKKKKKKKKKKKIKKKKGRKNEKKKKKKKKKRERFYIEDAGSAPREVVDCSSTGCMRKRSGTRRSMRKAWHRLARHGPRGRGPCGAPRKALSRMACGVQPP